MIIRILSFFVIILFAQVGFTQVDSTYRDGIPHLDSLLNVVASEGKTSDTLVVGQPVELNSVADSVELQQLKDSVRLLHGVKAQLTDSLRNHANRTIHLQDSLAQLSEVCNNLNYRIKESANELNFCRDSLSLLLQVVDSLQFDVDRLKKRNQLLQPLNKELNDRIANLQTTVEQQSEMLNQQIQKIKEKEQLFAEKELIYERAVQESKIDLVKLEGQLQSKNSELAGKDREIELLAESIADRKSSIQEKNMEIEEVRQRRNMAAQELDTLRNYVRQIEKDLILSKERLTYSDKEIKHLQKQLHDLTNKKKNIRLVQGLAIRNFRAPLYTLSPESSDNPDNYVISNENAGDYEFDFVTGATFRVLDLGKDNSRFTSDVGFFLGFGGKNLFKNFYMGPNIKLFDVIHINAGVNIAEFRLLKSGFSEGDRIPQGMSIPTVSKWELTPYFGLTFDFSLITSIAGKL